MANPPFNVDEVELDQVKDQVRFNTYGVPQNKTKTKKKDAKETVPNANYLWINQFATALNDTGRAALVMANSASDAGNSELDIRIKLIKSGIISQMVTLPTNLFTSVTLPATLWFFDKAKVKKDEILFIDARNIFTQIDRAHRKFSDEQIRNLGIITRLYEGKTEAFDALLADYRAKLADAPEISDDEDIMPKSYWQSNIDWLTDRFPEGKYRDVVGLCKVAEVGEILDENGSVIGYKEDSIGDQDFSLNPGRYVGVVIEDDGLTQEEFKQRIIVGNDDVKNEFSVMANTVDGLYESLRPDIFKMDFEPAYKDAILYLKGIIDGKIRPEKIETAQARINELLDQSVITVADARKYTITEAGKELDLSKLDIDELRNLLEKKHACI